MDNISLSQTVSISELPRDYLGLLKRSAKRKEPVVFLRYGKAVGALLAQSVLEQLLSIKRKYEEEKLFRVAQQGMKEYREGKAKKLKSLVDLMN